MRTVAGVLAGGTGRRFGSGMPKQMPVLAGRSLGEHAGAALEQGDSGDAITSGQPTGLPAQGTDRAFAQRPATDDCGIVLRYLPEIPVRVVPGSERNIKITYPSDLHIAEALLRTAGERPGSAPGQITSESSVL